MYLKHLTDAYSLHLRAPSETRMCLDFWEGKKTTKKQWAKHIMVWMFVLITSLSRLLILHSDYFQWAEREYPSCRQSCRHFIPSPPFSNFLTKKKKSCRIVGHLWMKAEKHHFWLPIEQTRKVWKQEVKAHCHLVVSRAKKLLSVSALQGVIALFPFKLLVTGYCLSSPWYIFRDTWCWY